MGTFTSVTLFETIISVFVLNINYDLLSAPSGISSRVVVGKGVLVGLNNDRRAGLEPRSSVGL